MISWLINHNQAIGLLIGGFGLGVMFAAWRQLLLEDRRWEYRLRSRLRRMP